MDDANNCKLLISLLCQKDKVNTLANNTRALGRNSLWHVASLAMAVTTKQRSLAWDDFREAALIESNPGSWLNPNRLGSKKWKRGKSITSNSNPSWRPRKEYNLQVEPTSLPGFHTIATPSFHIVHVLHLCGLSLLLHAHQWPNTNAMLILSAYTIFPSKIQLWWKKDTYDSQHKNNKTRQWRSSPVRIWKHQRRIRHNSLAGILAFAGLPWASPSLSVIGFCRMFQSCYVKLIGIKNLIMTCCIPHAP